MKGDEPGAVSRTPAGRPRRPGSRGAAGAPADQRDPEGRGAGAQPGRPSPVGGAELGRGWGLRRARGWQVSAGAPRTLAGARRTGTADRSPASADIPTRRRGPCAFGSDPGQRSGASVPEAPGDPVSSAPHQAGRLGPGPVRAGPAGVGEGLARPPGSARTSRG